MSSFLVLLLQVYPADIPVEKQSPVQPFGISLELCLSHKSGTSFSSF